MLIDTSTLTALTLLDLQPERRIQGWDEVAILGHDWKKANKKCFFFLNVVFDVSRLCDFLLFLSDILQIHIT